MVSAEESGSSPPTIRSMDSADVRSVVDVHLKSFPGFFLSFLGFRFLCLYYQSLLDFSQLSLVAAQGGRIVGFVVGIDNSFGFYRRLRQSRGVHFALAALPAAIRRPSTVPRLFRALRKRSPFEADDVPSVTLASFAVLPEMRRSGVGKPLMQGFEALARQRGFRRVVLETDLENNDEALRFYKMQGFVTRRTLLTPECRRIIQFAKDLSTRHERVTG